MAEGRALKKKGCWGLQEKLLLGNQAQKEGRRPGTWVSGGLTDGSEGPVLDRSQAHEVIYLKHTGLEQPPSYL